jgi:hypothetical protein
MADLNDIEARRQARKEREQNAVQSLFNAIAYQPTPQQEQRALSWLGHFAYETRSVDHHEREQDLRKRLENSGIEITINYYTGDDSYPTEYTIKYGDVQAMGPTFDLALIAFLERFLSVFPRTDEPRKDQQPRGFDAEDLSERAHEDWANDE